MVKGEQYDFFISYSSNDLPFVWDLVRRLGAGGSRVFLDRERLNGGDRLTQSLESAIKQSKSIILIISPTWLESEWCMKERAWVEERLNEDSPPRVVPIHFCERAQFERLDLCTALSRDTVSIQELSLAPEAHTHARNPGASEQVWHKVDRLSRSGFAQLHGKKIPTGGDWDNIDVIADIASRSVQKPQGIQAHWQLGIWVSSRHILTVVGPGLQLPGMPEETGRRSQKATEVWENGELVLFELRSSRLLPESDRRQAKLGVAEPAEDLRVLTVDQRWTSAHLEIYESSAVVIVDNSLKLDRGAPIFTKQNGDCVALVLKKSHESAWLVVLLAHLPSTIPYQRALALASRHYVDRAFRSFEHQNQTLVDELRLHLELEPEASFSTILDSGRGLDLLRKLQVLLRRSEERRPVIQRMVAWVVAHLPQWDDAVRAALSASSARHEVPGIPSPLVAEILMARLDLRGYSVVEVGGLLVGSCNIATPLAASSPHSDAEQIVGSAAQSWSFRYAWDLFRSHRHGKIYTSHIEQSPETSLKETARKLDRELALRNRHYEELLRDGVARPEDAPLYAFIKEPVGKHDDRAGRLVQELQAYLPSLRILSSGSPGTFPGSAEGLGLIEIVIREVFEL